MKVSRMQQLSLYVGLALVFGSTLSAPNVLAANAGDAKEAHTIVVTATRSEQQLSEVPASVGVVTGDDIRERHATNMNEAMRIVPGVDINTYGGGVGYTNSNAFRINGSDQVLYLVDGINMGAAGVKPADDYFKKICLALIALKYNVVQALPCMVPVPSVV